MWYNQLAIRIVWVLQTACMHASKYSEQAATCWDDKFRKTRRSLPHRSQFLFSCLSLADAGLAGRISALCLHVLRLQIIAEEERLTFHCNLEGLYASLTCQ